MRKTISLFLILAFSMALFISCSQSEETEFAPDYEMTADSQTFRGATFTYLMEDDGRVFGYVDNTLFSDLVLQRVKEVEQNLDVKIEFEYTSEDKINQYVQNEAFAVMASYSAVMAASNYLSPGVRAGLYYDLTAISGVNFLNTEKWGNIEYLKPMFWDGGLYGCFPAKYPLHMLNSLQGNVIVNEAFIKRLNQDDPREYVENGTWTWDKLEELMPVYAHTDDTGRYVYAYYSTIHWLFRSIQTTNGGNVVYKDENGEWQLSIHTQAQFEALDRGYSWAYGEFSPYVEIEPGNVWTNILKKFVEGESVLAVVMGDNIYGSEDSVAYLMEDFGVLTFPVGPNGSSSTPGITITSSEFISSIPALYAEPEMSAAVLDALYEPLPGYETDEETANYLRQYFFYDDRDVTNYMNAYKNVLYDYRDEGLTDVVINISNSRTMSEWLQKFEDADEENRKKYVVNIESTIDELFGERN